jgi:hypothetical protein
MLKTIEKIAICKTLIDFYKEDYEQREIFGMCEIVKKLTKMQIKERNSIYTNLFVDFPEFARHEKHGFPVFWFNPSDYQSRINYLEETIRIIKANENLKIEKIKTLLYQAAKDNNFLKVSQAKNILNNLKNQYNELPND